ncbi:MAG: phosphate ABC transporter substrate-binding protein [Verrucomicrobia bacterium]|nr:phosphate ABC transporter substrate-binding protein [Verrucomicrobiota bacterium]
MKTRLVKTIVVAACFAAAGSTYAGNVTVKGSDTMVILGQKWAEVYMKKNPGTAVQVTGGGSGTGIAALLNGTTDICNASRAMKTKETAQFLAKFKTRAREYKMCLDAISVYLNKNNPVQKLSFPQLEGIFIGKITNWKQVGGNDTPISLYGRENSSGTYEFFKEHVLGGKDFAAATKTMPGTAAVIQGVANDANGIGYGGVAYGEGVKAISVSKVDGGDAVAPSAESVRSGKYPISRFLFNYVDPKKDNGAVADYINWCLSDEGQAVVKNIGFFPLPKNMR